MFIKILGVLLPGTEQCWSVLTSANEELPEVAGVTSRQKHEAWKFISSPTMFADHT